MARSGLVVDALGIDDDLTGALTAINAFAPDVVFNLCESLSGDARFEPLLPMLLEMAKEVTPDGGGLRTKVRLEFVNLGELIRHMLVFADVKMADDLNLPRPVLPERADGLRLPEVVVVPPSTELLYVVAGLVERAEKLRGTRPEKGEDNILKIVGEGAAAALDLRLLGLQTTEPQKLDVSADRIYTSPETEHLLDHAVLANNDAGKLRFDLFNGAAETGDGTVGCIRVGHQEAF